MVPEIKAIDCLIVPNPPGGGVGRLGYLFPGLSERAEKGTSAEGLVAEMDEAGVEKGIIAIQREEDRDWVLDTIRKYPKRFIPALGGVDPRKGMEEIRRVERYAKDYGVQVIRLGPWRIQLPPNDRFYFPFYVKAIELGIVVQVNVGLPGPQYPGWVQDPIYLDEVCYFYPELKLCMTHVGHPWISTVTNMLTKWPNCYLVTNSWAPRHYPQELLQYMNTRGYNKVMFGTEYPVIPFKRAMEEIKQLPLRDQVRPKFLRENALTLFKWP